MRLITKEPGKKLHVKHYEQVAFSTLEVPTDAEIVLQSMEFEKSRSTEISVPPSTFRQDSWKIRQHSVSTPRSTPPPFSYSASILGHSPTNMLEVNYL